MELLRVGRNKNVMKNNSALYTKTCNPSYHLELQKGKREVYENITTPLNQK